MEKRPPTHIIAQLIRFHAFKSAKVDNTSHVIKSQSFSAIVYRENGENAPPKDRHFARWKMAPIETYKFVLRCSIVKCRSAFYDRTSTVKPFFRWWFIIRRHGRNARPIIYWILKRNWYINLVFMLALSRNTRIKQICPNYGFRLLDI